MNRFNLIKLLLLVVTVALTSNVNIAEAKTIEKNKSSKKTTTVVKKSVTTPNKKVTTPAKKVVVHNTNVTYKKKTPYIKAVRVLPHSAVTIKRNGINFYFDNGYYYRRDADRYVMTPAPAGLRIKTLPIGHTILKLMNRAYYYYQGTYYIKSGLEYEVVDAPQDIIVYTLPAEAELIVIEGEKYYVYNGIIYSIVLTPEGKAFKMSGEIEM